MSTKINARPIARRDMLSTLLLGSAASFVGCAPAGEAEENDVDLDDSTLQQTGQALQTGNRRANLETVKRAFAAIGRGDADAMMDNFTHDVSMELPFADPPTFMRGNQEIREYLREAFKVFKFVLTITEVHECLDPNKLVIEFTSQGTINGNPYANRYISVYWFRQGKVRAWREFFNPKLVDEAMTP